jgi:excisionase family DNA binding protein
LRTLYPELVRQPSFEGNSLRANDHADEDLHELLTVEDVAALLRVSKSWVYAHIRSRHMPRTDRLPHIKVGKYVRFEMQAVRTFLKRKSRTT